MPEISIICPVYNAEAYLAKCLDSLLAQTFRDWELIIVIDGSPDSSASIAESYAARDARIRIIYQENKGVSAARQTGLDAATGTYVIHADPDDWVEANMLQELHAAATTSGADVVICDYYVTDVHGNNTLTRQQPSDSKPGTVLRELFHHLHGSCCNKLVRRCTLSEYNIAFPEGINYCEDLLTWVQLFQHDEVKIAYLPKAFYHYIQHNSGVTRSYSPELIQQAQDVVSWLDRYYPEQEGKEQAINRHKINILHAAFEHPELYTAAEYRRLYPEAQHLVKRKGSWVNRTLISLSFIWILYKPCAYLYQLKCALH